MSRFCADYQPHLKKVGRGFADNSKGVVMGAWCVLWRAVQLYWRVRMDKRED